MAATGQYLTELGIELANQGHNVSVITGRRGYDDPDQLFSERETYRGVNIHRIATFGLNKTSRWRRAINFAVFLINCAARLVLDRKSVV